MLRFVLFLFALFKLNDPSISHLEICPTEAIIRGTIYVERYFPTHCLK